MTCSKHGVEMRQAGTWEGAPGFTCDQCSADAREQLCRDGHHNLARCSELGHAKRLCSNHGELYMSWCKICQRISADAVRLEIKKRLKSTDVVRSGRELMTQ